MKAIFRGLVRQRACPGGGWLHHAQSHPLDQPGRCAPAFTAPVADKQAPIWPEANWWVNFKADELPALEDTAQKENLDLAAAAARVLQAEAQDGVAFSALLPTVNLQGQASAPAAIAARALSPPDRAAPSCRCRPHVETTPILHRRPGRQLSADFWGLYRDRLARRGKICAPPVMPKPWSASRSSPAWRQQYFTVLALRERIAIARQNIDAAKRILTVVQAKVTNGVSSNLDLAQEQAVVATQKRACPA